MLFKYLFLVALANGLLGEDGHGIRINTDEVCCSHTPNEKCVNSYPCNNFNFLNMCTKNVHDNFVKFINKFNKKYNSIEEMSYRMGVFAHNLVIAKHQNTYYKNYYSSVDNQFSDLTESEFENIQGTKISIKKREIDSILINNNYSNLKVNSIDWRKEGIVSDIKDQGMCGSCWTFSTVAAIESAYAKKYGDKINLSEQNLIDCVKNDELDKGQPCCNGCNGGLMDNAFDYIIRKQFGGIDTEESYPYEGKNDNCRFNQSEIGAKITSWIDITAGDEIALANAVAKNGVVSVALDASKQWQLYKAGILVPKELFGCSSDPNKADHGVVIVGYGTENNVDYWIVRNSWGTSWGEKGYIRLIRGQNACGIANHASYPNIS